MKLATRLMVDALTQFAASGFTMQETAAETGLSYAAVGMYARKHGIKFYRTYKGAGAPTAPTARSERMAALYKAGKTLEQIGSEYGITRERVRQIINKYHGLTGKHGGKTKLAKDKRKQVCAARDARSMRKWGCPWSQYVLLRDAGVTHPYNRQRHNSDFRGIAWELTLWQWWTIWQESGHWADRGRGGRGYHMCRKADQGPYSVDNVYIATGTANILDYWAAVRSGAKKRAPQHNSRLTATPEEREQAALRAKEVQRAAYLRYHETPKYKLRVALRRQGLPKEQRDAIVAAQFGASA